MRVVISGDGAKLVLDQGPRRNSVRPSVDALFESAAEVFGDRALGVVLTGMGEDGLLGAKAIKRGGGAMLIQDKESCVVFGMPGAVFEAGAFDRMGNLESLSSLLGSLVAPGQRPGKLR
jgi:two-component system chemotaxis response regulator CheB